MTKSGTNALSGLFGGTFRDSDWNAEDPVLNVVIPFSNQQFSTRVGGPILRDRLHYFANYEYDRTPEDEHLEHAVSGVQHHAGRQADQEDRRRAGWTISCRRACG